MWSELFVKEARRRREIFANLSKYLRTIVEAAKSVDPSAEVYLFGSVAEGKATVASDIDVLIVTKARPEVVLDALWRKGIEEPFEIHVIPPELLRIYAKRAVLQKIYG